MKRLLVVPFLVLAAAACAKTASDAAPTVVSADAGADAGSAPDASSEQKTLLPYPAGPYGGSIGDVMPDFDALGYSLDREHRDARELPFHRVTASEVRSDPKCTCMLVLWDVSGFTCPWSTLENQLITAALDADPTMCAFELLDGNLDTALQGPPTVDNLAGPTTRADLDAFTFSGRQNYPVGIVTTATRDTFSGRSVYAFPLTFVVDPRSMRFIDTIPGFSAGLIDRAKAVCAGAQKLPETIAKGLAPEQIVVAGDALLVRAADGIHRIPIAGGSDVLLAGPSSAPTAIAVAGTTLAWIAGAELGRMGTDGSAPQVLASGSAAYTSVAVDGAYVYGTRADGVVGRVPLAGGPVETILSGEASPTSITVVDTDLVFVATGTNEVVRVPKAGGARQLVPWSSPAAAASQVPSAIWPAPGGFAIELANASGDSLVNVGGPSLVGQVGFLGKAANFVLEQDRYIGAEHAPGAPTIVVDDVYPGTPPSDSPSAPVGHLNPGQPPVTWVATDGTYLYWSTAESAPGAKDGTVRRRRR